MTDRLVDPTRQGIDLPERRAPGDVDWTGRAKPVPLADAISMVDAWAPDFAPFTMHQMCRALREGLDRQQKATAKFAEHIVRLIAERAVHKAQANDDAARLANLRRENDELRRELHARVIPEQTAALADECDRLKAENESLRFRAAQSGVSLVDGPDIYGSRIEHFPLSRVLELMDAWRPGVERWGLHQMCRRLREEYEDLQRTFDLRRKADMRAIGRWQAAHPGKEYVWPDRADMVVWLLEAHDDEASAMEPDIIGRALETITAYDAAEQRMLAATPCGPKRDGGGTCTLSGHPYAACCRLRVPLRFGEPVETDHLPDSGEVHLFAPGRGKDQARVSAGCVKLIEPTIHERNETLDHDFDRSAG